MTEEKLGHWVMGLPPNWPVVKDGYIKKQRVIFAHRWRLHRGNLGSGFRFFRLLFLFRFFISPPHLTRRFGNSTNPVAVRTPPWRFFAAGLLMRPMAVGFVRVICG